MVKPSRITKKEQQNVKERVRCVFFFPNFSFFSELLKFFFVKYGITSGPEQVSGSVQDRRLGRIDFIRFTWIWIGFQMGYSLWGMEFSDARIFKDFFIIIFSSIFRALMVSDPDCHLPTIDWVWLAWFFSVQSNSRCLETMNEFDFASSRNELLVLFLDRNFPAHH